MMEWLYGASNGGPISHVRQSRIRYLIAIPIIAASAAGIVGADFLDKAIETRNLAPNAVYSTGDSHHATFRMGDGPEGRQSYLELRTDLGVETFLLERGADGRHKLTSRSFAPWNTNP